MNNKSKLTLLKAISRSQITEFRFRSSSSQPREIPPGLVPAFIKMCSRVELARQAEACRHAWSPLND
jgi:hypothetical protein